MRFVIKPVKVGPDGITQEACPESEAEAWGLYERQGRVEIWIADYPTRDLAEREKMNRAPNAAAFRALRDLREQFKETVTRQEVNKEMLGVALAAMREDAGVSIYSMASELGVGSDDVLQFESGAGGLNLGQQVTYIKVCTL